MIGNRHRSPGSARGSERKKRRRHCSPDLAPSPPELEKDVDSDSDLDSRSSLSASARDHRRHHCRQRHDHAKPEPASRMRSSHSRVRPDPHQRKANLSAPAEHSDMTVAARESSLLMQTAARSRRKPDQSSSSSDEEVEMYDHRSRPLLRRNRNRHPAEKPPRFKDSGQGILMGASMVMVGLFACFADAG